MSINITKIEYLQEATCKRERDNCSCLRALQNYIKKQVTEGTTNPALEKKLTRKNNGGIAYTGCGHANQIIAVTIDNMEDLMTSNNESTEKIIKKNVSYLVQFVKAFRAKNNNDPHLQAIDTKRNQQMNRLEIEFQRGLSAEQRNELEQQIKNQLEKNL